MPAGGGSPQACSKVRLPRWVHRAPFTRGSGRRSAPRSTKWATKYAPPWAALTVHFVRRVPATGCSISTPSHGHAWARRACATSTAAASAPTRSATAFVGDLVVAPPFLAGSDGLDVQLVPPVQVGEAPPRERAQQVEGGGGL